MKFTNQNSKPVYSTRLPEGDVICNCPEFLLEALQGGYKVRKLRWVRQPWELGEVVTVSDIEQLN